MDIFPGCGGKGTNLVALIYSKIFDRRFQIVNLAIYSSVSDGSVSDGSVSDGSVSAE